MALPLSHKKVAALRKAPPTKGEPNRLKTAMRLAGVTQVELGIELGWEQTRISKIANGKFSRLPVDTALRVAAAFGCAVEDLFPLRDSEAA